MLKVHPRSRSVVLAALAISLLALLGFPQMATAAGKKGEAPGQEKRADAADPDPAEAGDPGSTPSAGTPTAADSPEGDSVHDADNGPGGQVCDGDPDNAPGAGGNYENTCPAGPSQNGAGDGAANGKPCAGCVGNADDKNPPGQAPSGPGDANNGYECDQKGRSANEGNNGVGYGNPAHTGCTGAPGVTPTCPDGSALPASGDEDDCPTPTTPTCPDGSALPAGGAKDCPKPATCPNGDALPASGRVDDCVTVTPLTPTPTGGATAVLGETFSRPVEVLGVTLTEPAGAPAAAPAAAPASLARTGGFQLVGLVEVALALALTGLALVFATRARRWATADPAGRTSA